MSDFSGTLQTAAGADSTAALLRRAAKYAGGLWSDARLLQQLAEKYTDYASGLRAMVPAAVETADDQPPLL